MTQESTPLYQGKGSQTGTQTTAPADAGQFGGVRNIQGLLQGTDGDDRINFYKGKGTHSVDGGAGTDTLQLYGSSAAYRIEQLDGVWTLSVGSERVPLRNVEQVELHGRVFSLEQAAAQQGGMGDDEAQLFAQQTAYDGGAGVDKVHFDGNYGQARVERIVDAQGERWQITQGDRTVELRNVELLKFDDLTIDLRSQGDAAAQAQQRLALADGWHLIGNDLSYRVGDFWSTGNNRLEGRGGDDFLLGGGGTDTAVYRGALADYEIVFDTTTQTATVRDKQAGRDGLDTLFRIEKLQFADGLFDLQAVAKLVASEPLVMYTAATLVSGSDEDWVINVAGEDQPDVFSPEPGFPGFEGSARLQLVGSWGEQGIPDLP